VHVRDGAVTGAEAMLAAKPSVDDWLALAWSTTTCSPMRSRRSWRTPPPVGSGTGRQRPLDGELLKSLAAEQATDAVFELLRWPDGDFAFVDR